MLLSSQIALRYFPPCSVFFPISKVLWNRINQNANNEEVKRILLGTKFESFGPFMKEPLPRKKHPRSNDGETWRRTAGEDCSNRSRSIGVNTGFEKLRYFVSITTCSVVLQSYITQSLGIATMHSSATKWLDFLICCVTREQLPLGLSIYHVALELEFPAVTNVWRCKNAPM